MYSEVPCGLIMQQIWAQYVHLSRNAPRKGTKKITVLFVLLKGTSSSDILNQKPHYLKRKCRRRSIMFQNRDFFPAFGTYSSSREEPLLALKDDREIQTLTLALLISPERPVLSYSAPLQSPLPLLWHRGNHECPNIYSQINYHKNRSTFTEMFHKLEPLQQEIFFSCISYCG